MNFVFAFIFCAACNITIIVVSLSGVIRVKFDLMLMCCQESIKSLLIDNCHFQYYAVQSSQAFKKKEAVGHSSLKMIKSLGHN